MVHLPSTAHCESCPNLVKVLSPKFLEALTTAPGLTCRDARPHFLWGLPAPTVLSKSFIVQCHLFGGEGGKRTNRYTEK